MKVAVEGCAHGELDKIYETVAFLEQQNNFKVDLLIICGDFQSVRNKSDLLCMAVPPCYRKLNTFYKYYSGEAKAPLLTVFIGGNHEASNYLAELNYGGWVAPNIFYLGAAGVVKVGGIRIAGLSGIYKGHDYLKGHFEIPPYDENMKRSAYHIRNLEVFRLKQLSDPLDVVISHDWPRSVYNFGDKDALLRKKKFFKKEVESNVLGSRPAEELLNTLRPQYWFAAHLHCKFAALVPHKNGTDGTCKYTKFLALDKCLPRRQFLQILDIGQEMTDRPVQLEYDLEWLCILRSTNHLLSTGKNHAYMPGPGCSERWAFTPDEEEKNNVKNLFDGNLTIPENFVQTCAVHDPDQTTVPAPKPTINPQTSSFCQKLGIVDPMTLLLAGGPAEEKLTINNFTFADEDEADVTSGSQISINPDEISLEDEDDEEISDTDEDAEKADVENIDGLFFIDKSRSDLLTSTPRGRSFLVMPEPIMAADDSEKGGSVEIGGGVVTSTPKGKQQATGRSFLVMPEPKMTPNVADDCASRCSEKVELLGLEGAEEDPEKKRDCTHVDISNQASSMTAIKKMKRRNQAIYQADDDSDH